MTRGNKGYKMEMKEKDIKEEKMMNEGRKQRHETRIGRNGRG